MRDPQLLKGILEGCVLAIISKGETYGYRIITQLEQNGFDRMLEGTLYPVLTRLEKRQSIVCRIGKSPLGPMRKYYSITENGLIELEQFKNDFARITRSAMNVLEDEDEG